MSLGAFWSPAVSVSGHAADLGINAEFARVATPLGVPVERRPLWLAIAKFGRLELVTDAVLPDSGWPVPDQLWLVEMGFMHVRPLADGGSIGGNFLFGSASDRPYAASRDLTLMTVGFYNRPAARGDDEWSFSIFVFAHVPDSLPAARHRLRVAAERPARGEDRRAAGPRMEPHERLELHRQLLSARELQRRRPAAGSPTASRGESPVGATPSLRHTTRTVPQLSHEHWYRNWEGVKTYGWASMLSGIGGLLIAATLRIDSTISSIIAVVSLTAVMIGIGMRVGMAFGILQTFIQGRRYEDGAVWLDGMCPEFLAAFPDLKRAEVPSET